MLLTDYTKYCSHLGRAYAALTREWAEGHSLTGRAHRTDERFVGVELFQIESYDPDHSDDVDRPGPARPRPRSTADPPRSSPFDRTPPIAQASSPMDKPGQGDTK